MQYRIDEKSGNRLSILGFGCMRFPRNLAVIDQKKVESLILSAIDEGVNYFDTAYLYPGSESVLGSVVKKNNLRSKIYLATKLPFSLCKSAEDFEKYFSKQLASLDTDYIDYYLMHNVNNHTQWQGLCEMGICEWIAEKKSKGEIRQIGFSFHGALEEFEKVLEAYDWDFCQIQYNYANENYQAGVTGLKKAAERHIPVIIMEPLLGGKLATGLTAPALEAFARVDRERTPAAWALRWLWNQPEVTVVLSGMNEAAQLSDNIKTACESEANMLTEAEKDAYEKVLEIFKKSDKIPCTGCSYCMPCPNGVNIPACFASYNASYAHGLMTGFMMYTTSTSAHRSKGGLASNCIGCGKCEAHCPQKIAIRTSLKEVKHRMEPFYYNFVMKIVRSRAKSPKPSDPES